MRAYRSEWKLRKEQAWRRIWEDLEIGYIDRDLLPILLLINADSELYTTSSCSGRIVFVDLDYPWERDETGIVFKSHVPITPSEVGFIYHYRPYRKLWAVASGPIIHVYCYTGKKAVEILTAARKTGFKHSGIMYVSKTRGIFLELVTGVYVAQLVKTSNAIFIKPEDVNSFVGLLNSVLIEGKKRLQRLYLELSKILPEKPDERVSEDLKNRQLALNKTPLEAFIEVCREKYAKPVQI